MRLQRMRDDIQRILDDENLGRDEKIGQLRKMYTLVRGEQRAATESPMAPDDDDLGAMQIELEKAFERLGTKAWAPEDRGAATL